MAPERGTRAAESPAADSRAGPSKLQQEQLAHLDGGSHELNNLPPPSGESRLLFKKWNFLLLLLAAFVAGLAVSVVWLLDAFAMKIEIPSFSLWTGLLAGAGLVQVDAQFHYPPGVDVWCGKAYRPEFVCFPCLPIKRNQIIITTNMPCEIEFVGTY
jgi:hypothetical protein